MTIKCKDIFYDENNTKSQPLLEKLHHLSNPKQTLPTSSPPSFTSPLSSRRVNVPVPSNWDIMSQKKGMNLQRQPLLEEDEDLGLEWDEEENANNLNIKNVIHSTPTLKRTHREHQEREEIGSCSKKRNLHSDLLTTDHSAFDELLGFMSGGTSAINTPFTKRIMSDDDVDLNDFYESKAPSRSYSINMDVQVDYTQIPSKNQFTIAYNSAGTRFYFPKRHKETLKSCSNTDKDSFKLLSCSIYEMMRKVEAMHSLEKMSDKMDVSPSITSNKTESLWVDKYKPKMYIDLAGDEVFLI